MRLWRQIARFVQAALRVTSAAWVAMLITPGYCRAAEPAPALDSGDTAWVLSASALVLIMTPGLALFYGGMVRSKNVLGTVMQSFFAIAIVSVQWAVIGYSLSFGPDLGGIVGGLDWMFLRGVGPEPSSYARTIPHYAFMIFQAMFAIITPALITGAFAERMRFSAYVLFTFLWATFIYDPICHWVWGGGWLGARGALDFAGGTVVHINAGIAALAAALVMGPRMGFPREPMPPHNLSMTVLGAGLLWFGWFGFNAGSALSSAGLAASAFVATHLAAAAATVGWAATERIHRGKASVLGAVSGAVAGLVAITPAAGFVGPNAGMIIGLVAGVLCYIAAVVVKFRVGYDDSLDAFGVHCVGGVVGALLTGVFASTAVNSAGADGLLYGNFGQFLDQVIAVVATLIYAFVGTVVVLKITDGLLGLRVEPEEEVAGLDLTQHGEAGYNL